MNTVQSDMSDKVTDIFVLTVRETAVPLFTGHLTKKGYRVTLFTNGTSLLETLRTGKPDLLIADATTLDREAFEVCRCIKSDDELWIIPVLILTNASMLSDILQVLDCNADNFIPHPFDLPAGLSVIESMLATPVERQTPDQMKTQFKINLDDHIYSVAANRRKLLELLLSSFETAVNKTSELSHVKTELQTLSESAKYLEDRVADQTRLIDTIKATLHQKEQKITTLTHEIEEKKKLLAQKTRKALILTCDDTNRTFQTSACSDTNTLIQQISELSHELETAKTDLDTVQEELEEEKIHHTSLECTLELLGQQKEYLEKTLRSVTDEHEQLISAFEAERNRVVSAEKELNALMQQKEYLEKTLRSVTGEHEQLISAFEAERNRVVSAEQEFNALTQQKEYLEKTLRSVTEEHEQLISALEAERNRVVSAEQEFNALMQAKTQSELELSLIINEFKGAKTQQAEDLNRLKTELEREENRRISAENQLGTLRQEKEQSESFLRSSVTTLNDQIEDLRGQLKITRTALENEENTIRSLKENLAEIVAGHEATMARVQDELESDKVTLAKQKCDLDTATASLHTLERSLSTIKIQNTTLAGELDLEHQRKTQSDHQVHLLADDLKKVREALDSERHQHEAVDESFEILVPALRRTDRGLHTQVNERYRRQEIPENKRKLRVTCEDITEGGIGEPDLFEEKPIQQELQAAADQPVLLQKQLFSPEETAEIQHEDGQAVIVQDPDIPVIADPPSLATVIPTIPDSRKSPDSEDEQTPSRESPLIPEVSLETVTDIIDFFGEEDSCEEDNVS